MLPRVPAKMPKIIWYLFLVEFAERASYYGSAQIMTNFVLYPLPQGKHSLEFDLLSNISRW